MADANSDHGEQPTTSLLKELGANVTTLIGKEVELARAEMLVGIRDAKRASMWFALALVPAAVALILFALAIAFALGAYMPMWLAALVPAVLLMAGSAALLMAGKREAEHAESELKPTAAAQSFEQDRRFLKEQFGHLKESVTRSR